MESNNTDAQSPRTPIAAPAVDIKTLEKIGRQLLIAIGENPKREGLADTPARWARWWAEFIDYQPGKCDTCFTASTVDQMVVVRGMRVWSLCEHHLLPFYCDVSVAYITNKKMIGLSKVARIAHKHAHRLNVQEQLVKDIADEVSKVTDSDNVAVIANGRHLCMSMRGIQTPADMISSDMRGLFKYESKARAEFLELAKV